MNQEFINGPTKYVRLEGVMNRIKKEIHIFFDKHYALEDQTRCESFDSVDITYYLYTLIKELNEKMDFFMDIGTE